MVGIQDGGALLRRHVEHVDARVIGGEVDQVGALLVDAPGRQRLAEAEAAQQSPFRQADFVDGAVVGRQIGDGAAAAGEQYRPAQSGRIQPILPELIAVEVEGEQRACVGGQNQQPTAGMGAGWRQPYRQLAGVDTDTHGPERPAIGGSQSVKDAVRQGRNDLIGADRLRMARDAMIEEDAGLVVLAASGRGTRHIGGRHVLDIAAVSLRRSPHKGDCFRVALEAGDFQSLAFQEGLRLFDSLGRRAATMRRRTSRASLRRRASSIRSRQPWILPAMLSDSFFSMARGSRCRNRPRSRSTRSMAGP